MSLLLALVPFVSGGGGTAWGAEADGFAVSLGIGVYQKLSRLRAQASLSWVRLYLSQKAYATQGVPSGGSEEVSWAEDLAGPRISLNWGEKRSVGLWGSAGWRLGREGWLGGFGAEAWMWGSVGGVGLEWGRWPPASVFGLKALVFVE